MTRKTLSFWLLDVLSLARPDPAPVSHDQNSRPKLAVLRPVSIPQRDPNPDRRRARNREQLDQYQYTWHRPEGVATAVRVPWKVNFRAHAVFHFICVKLTLLGHDIRSIVVRAVFGPQGKRGSPEVCASLFTGARTPFVAKYLEGAQGHDELHAWQRIAGSNPLMIRRTRTIPDAFPVRREHFLTTNLTDDSLEAALGEGRIYLCDWTSLDGIPTGEFRGERKYLYGPWALYVQSRQGSLRPVAIQCRATPGENVPIFTPADGKSWEMAKLVVQCADTHFQALHFHLGRCHFLMEAFALATMRCLSDLHPLKALLRPSMQFTLAINHMIRDELMLPGARMDRMMAPTYQQCLSIVRRSVKSFRLSEALPPADITGRDVGDLSPYPWREDALDIWNVIHRFVNAYLRLYYDLDEEVRSDSEVAAWAQDMGSDWGGRIDVPVPQDLGMLTDLASYIIFVGGPLHSLINYSQFDNMAFAPNMPMALYGPAPTASRDDVGTALERMYVPRPLAQYGFFFEQSQLKENLLGHYPDGTFSDSRVAPVCAEFRRMLSEVEARIEERNRRRLVPFTWLRPSQIRASIHS